MISLIEALNYRCLRYVRQPLGPFHVLVGPNASGKTTFLDAVGFLRDLISDGLEQAVAARVAEFADLVWRGQQGSFELAVELRIPEEKRELLEDPMYDTARYEIAVGYDLQSQEVRIDAEQAFLKHAEEVKQEQRRLFPHMFEKPGSIISPRRRRGVRRLFTKNPEGTDYFSAEAHPRQGRWQPTYKLGPRKSTLANLPEDEKNFPVSSWLKQYLGESVEKITLNSLAMRRASRPGQGLTFKPDGSNLPWVVGTLEKKTHKFNEWIAHVRTALPDLTAVETREREDDRHRYLRLVYEGGIVVPSWTASDGTLRLLALTLPAYLDELKGVYLIEEPENGIHPRAVETMYQSLSSVYDAQVLLATHSPVILSVATPADVLCFAKTQEGATDIVSGDRHPGLADWRGEVSFGTLFASGVLG